MALLRFDRIAVALLFSCGASCSTLLDTLSPSGLCGDGVVQTEFGEQCDPAASSGPACSSSCRLESCGNGVVDRNEECDHGQANDDNGDCTTRCTSARCGDGLVHDRGSGPFEVCDDGNTESGDGCNHRCTLRGRLTVIGGMPGGKGVADGTGSAARFGGAWGLAVDATNGALYVGDTDGCSVRKFSVATGRVETVAGRPGECPHSFFDGFVDQATFTVNPKHLALIGQSLYVAENEFLRRVDLGTGTGGFDTAVSTCLQFPESRVGVTALAPAPDDSALYLASFAGIYRMQLPCRCDRGESADSCTIELVVGEAEHRRQTRLIRDLPGLDARFSFLSGMATDAVGQRLYVTDDSWVRFVDLSVTPPSVTTIAGQDAVGHRDGPGGDAQFFVLRGIAHRRLLDAQSPVREQLFVVEQTQEVVDRQNNGRLGWGNIRQLSLTTGNGGGPEWEVSTLAGIYGSIRGSGESDGFGSSARFVAPSSVAVLGETLYVGADASLRSISLSSGQVQTAAGVLVADSTYFEVGAAASSEGTLYVALFSGEVLALPVASSRPTRTLGLCRREGPDYHRPLALAAGNRTLYVFDLAIPGICRIDLEGKLGQPCCEGCVESCEIVGDMSGITPPVVATGMTYDASRDRLYLTDFTANRLFEVDPGTRVPHELTLAVDAQAPRDVYALNGKLYVADYDGHQIMEVDPASGAIRYLVSGIGATVDGRGQSASICHPTALASDGESLFVAESNCKEPDDGRFHGHAVRELDLETGMVRTVLGPGPLPFVVQGAGARASLNHAAAMTYDSQTRALYVADSWDNVILRVD